MHNQFRLYRRCGGVFYAENVSTKRQESLKTRDRVTAERLLHAKNAAAEQPSLNLAVARVHLAAHDPAMVTRTWQRVIDEFCSHGRASTQERALRAFNSHTFETLRSKPILETTAEDFLNLLRNCGSAGSHYLRRLHNLALNLGWLAWPILHKAVWPKQKKVIHRAITEPEFNAIVAAEKNEERRAYYEVLWEVGAAQLDAAELAAENIDWGSRTLIYDRRKLREGSEPCVLRIGSKLAAILKRLPTSGPLFPTLCKTGSKERAAEFRRRCRLLGFRGITLHSFRYAWAERAYRSGYPERFAQAALGHASKAVHRAYSRGAKVSCPPLEDFEALGGSRVIPFPRDSKGYAQSAKRDESHTSGEMNGA